MVDHSGMLYYKHWVSIATGVIWNFIISPNDYRWAACSEILLKQWVYPFDQLDTHNFGPASSVGRSRHLPIVRDNRVTLYWSQCHLLPAFAFHQVLPEMGGLLSNSIACCIFHRFEVTSVSSFGFGFPDFSMSPHIFLEGEWKGWGWKRNFNILLYNFKPHKTYQLSETRHSMDRQQIGLQSNLKASWNKSSKQRW